MPARRTCQHASGYFATPLGTLSAAQLDELLASNLRAPLLLLTQACARHFGVNAAVVNIVDAQLWHPQPGYPAHYAAKAGLWSLTETPAPAPALAPRVRVNAIAPGHMLWATSGGVAEHELARIPLGRPGGAEEIARVLRFLLSADAAYITGAILPVDSGLHLR